MNSLIKYFHALLESSAFIQLVLKIATTLFGLFRCSYSLVIGNQVHVVRDVERKKSCSFLFPFLIYQVFG